MVELYQEYDKDMYKRSAKVLMKKVMYIMLILGVAIVALSIPSYFQHVGDGIILSVVGAVFCTLYFLMPFIFVGLNARNKIYLQKFTFTPDTVKVELFDKRFNNALVSNTEFGYAQFVDMKEINGTIYLFIAKNVAFLINAKSFPSVADKLLVMGYFRESKLKNTTTQTAKQ